nr:MAG TPA: hypothetical protein [Caudoviricetes sp.]
MQIKSSLQNLTPNRPINGRFLNLTNSLFPDIPIATCLARRNLSIRDGQLIFNNSLIILNGHMSRFLTIVYARQFYSLRPPAHASLRSAWANWLAYNMGKTKLLWSTKPINIISSH